MGHARDRLERSQSQWLSMTIRLICQDLSQLNSKTKSKLDV